EKIDHVMARQVPADDPQLAAKSVDVIFLCNVYHHLSQRSDYLKKLAAALKPGGRIAIVDYHKRADVTAGAPLEHRIAQEKVIEELRAAGFSLAQEHSFLPSQYFLLFQSASPYTVSALAADVAAVVKAQPSDAARMQGVAPLLERFLREGSLEEKVQHPQHGIDVTSYMLFAAPDETFFIAALVLRPGAHTPVHDHQTWTVWGTYKGKDKETPFSLGAEGADDFPQLQPLTPRVLPDQGIVFTPRPPHDIHIVENVGDTVSVSIHIHGADMRKQERNLYDLRKRVVIPFVQSYEEGS
ncbi:MAG: methyltransferase, partial [Candidatus Binatia bacterium]